MNNLIRNSEFFLVKFPIIFPIIYFFILFTFPNFETELIFITILLLAETHFGATWPFFLDKVNKQFIKEKKFSLIIFPIGIFIFSILGFFLFKNTFLLIFFAANVYHVTRQSFGVCKLYCNLQSEKIFQEYLIYFLNLLFFIVAFFRFYYPLITNDHLFILNTSILLLLFLLFVFYVIKFKFSDNFLTFVTGSIIFYPVCFVSNPVHAIIMGVTMHYTQYLFLTHYVYRSRKKEENPNFKSFIFNRYVITILIYSMIMSLFSIFGKFDSNILKQLILIPIIGQIIHFYLDSQLWKFSEKHNRDNILRFINNLKNI
ncbi:hypothetical protein N9O72_00915 [bacterium]|nr:hypothetical protein [bacterium]